MSAAERTPGAVGAAILCAVIGDRATIALGRFLARFYDIDRDADR